MCIRDSFNTGTIIEWSRLKTGSQFVRSEYDSSVSSILKNYAQRGYFSASIDSEVNYFKDSGEVNISFRITEGEPASIRNVIVERSDSINMPADNEFIYLENQIFDKYEIENVMGIWLDRMENEGYPFAKAYVSSFKLNNEESGKVYADIKILIDRGMYSKIDKIEIDGNSSTKDYVIIRELRLNENQVYSQTQVEELPARLNRLRFFEPVQMPGFYVNNLNEGVLTIKVKEKQTNSFDGIIGYIPPVSDKQKGYVTGLVNISLRNLFGTGRAAAIRWQQYDRLSQEMEIRYLEPWILSYPFNISAGLYQRKQDSSYVQRRVEGTLEFLATEDISAGLTVNSENVIPVLSETSRFTVFTSNSLTTGLNLKIDTRDDPYAPTKGLLLLNSYSFSRKKIYGPQQYITPQTITRLNLQRITVDFSFYYLFFSRQVAAIGIHGRELRGNFFEESDLFYLGGTSSLRGYREKQYAGSRLFWSNTEYRFLLTRRTYAFVFFDTGYFIRKEDLERNILKTEAFKTGYGAGLNIETGIGVLAVSYALGAGDNFSDGKIHFGIVNEF